MGRGEGGIRYHLKADHLCWLPLSQEDRFASRILSFSHNIYLNLKIPERFRVLPKVRGQFCCAPREVIDTDAGSYTVATPDCELRDIAGTEDCSWPSGWKSRERYKEKYKLLFFCLVSTSILANLNMTSVVKGKHSYNHVNIGNRGLWPYVRKLKCSLKSLHS